MFDKLKTGQHPTFFFSSEPLTTTTTTTTTTTVYYPFRNYGKLKD